MIYSPIDGVVLNCAVEEGQTVTASMSTPELFTIVNDLTTMQVQANIDEADIGQVNPGQRVEFTVDAYSDDKFEGEVAEVRLQPNEASNVVTYSVIIEVANPELKLMPGLTASIITYVEEAYDVLCVSEAATSFTPDQQLLQKYISQNGEEKKPENEDADKNQNRPSSPPAPKDELDDSHRIVWVKVGYDIKPVEIEIGIDDGDNVEIISGLDDGSEILTSLVYTTNSIKTNDDDDEQKNPFIQESQKGPGDGQRPQGPPK